MGCGASARCPFAWRSDRLSYLLFVRYGADDVIRTKLDLVGPGPYEAVRIPHERAGGRFSLRPRIARNRGPSRWIVSETRQAREFFSIADGYGAERASPSGAVAAERVFGASPYCYVAQPG